MISIPIIKFISRSEFELTATGETGVLNKSVNLVDVVFTGVKFELEIDGEA